MVSLPGQMNSNPRPAALHETLEKPAWINRCAASLETALAHGKEALDVLCARRPPHFHTGFARATEVSVHHLAFATAGAFSWCFLQGMGENFGLKITQIGDVKQLIRSMGGDAR